MKKVLLTLAWGTLMAFSVACGSVASTGKASVTTSPVAAATPTPGAQGSPVTGPSPVGVGGTLHYDLSGPYVASGDLPYVGVDASSAFRFQGVSNDTTIFVQLYYLNKDGATVQFIEGPASGGGYLISTGNGTPGVVPGYTGATCAWSNLKVGAPAVLGGKPAFASGSLACSNDLLQTMTGGSNGAGGFTDSTQGGEDMKITFSFTN